MIEGLNVLSPEERKRQIESEKIASVLREATGEFLTKIHKAGIDIKYLQINWKYNDGHHIISGGA